MDRAENEGMNTEIFSNRDCMAKADVPQAFKELILYLEGLTERASMEKLDELLEGVEITRKEIVDCVSFGSATYRRNLICESEWFELLCICWKSGQRSPIHNHAGSTCGLRIIHGVATETLFEWTDCGQIKAIQSTDCGVDHVCTTQDAEIHQVSNLQAPGCDLITLHIYSPPLRTMDTYSLMGDVEEYTPTNFMSCHFGGGI